MKMRELPEIELRTMIVWFLFFSWFHKCYNILRCFFLLFYNCYFLLLATLRQSKKKRSVRKRLR